MFSKKLSLTFLVLAIGLSACGTQSTPETSSSEVVQSQPVVPSLQGSASAAQPETVSKNTQSTAPLTYPIVDTDQGNCYDAQSQVACPNAGCLSSGRMPNITEASLVTRIMAMEPSRIT